MSYSEDDDDFFFDDDLTDAAVITGVIGTVYGFFDREYVEFDEIAGYRPVFTCSTATAVDVAVGAAIQLTGETEHYHVVQKVKIDRMETKLILET